MPESKTSQPHSLSCLVCKTSIPGSNPGGASNPKGPFWLHRSRIIPATWGNTVGPNGLSIGSRRHVSSSKYPRAARPDPNVALCYE